MKKSNKCFLDLLVFVIACLHAGNTACYTPWGSPGRCINIRQCSPLLTLLKQRPLPRTVFNVLRSAQCGFEGIEPKVCCVVRNERSKTITTPIEIKPVTVEKRPETTTTPLPPPPPLVPIDKHPNLRLLENDLCTTIPEPRIYGGDVAAINEFPWMALLGYDIGAKTPQFRCGASLLNKHYVLTAAHCVVGLPDDVKLVTVRIGDYDLSSEQDCDKFHNGVGSNCAPPYQEFQIDRVHVHPEFTKRMLHNDIALIRFKGEADLRPVNVQPICLPLGNDAFLKAREVVVSGWGSTEFGLRSKKLMKVTLPLVNLEKCSSAYKHQFVKIWHKQICAGGSNKMDSCSGDSGGPLQALVVHGGKPRIVQYGIVSFGPQSCGMDGFPAVYTSVAYYMRWILDTITD